MIAEEFWEVEFCRQLVALATVPTNSDQNDGKDPNGSLSSVTSVTKILLMLSEMSSLMVELGRTIGALYRITACLEGGWLESLSSR